jgi:hypothetical protein
MKNLEREIETTIYDFNLNDMPPRRTAKRIMALIKEQATSSVSSSAGLEGLLEKWKKRSKRFADNYQFGRDGDDDGSYTHGMYDMIDECIDELEEAIKAA